MDEVALAFSDWFSVMAENRQDDAYCPPNCGSTKSHTNFGC